MAKGKEILRGYSGSPGVVTGTVRVVDKDKEKMEALKPGEIMVAERTEPAHMFAMKKAAAFISDLGGKTSHTSIVAREMGKPAVVGTVSATELLKDGQKVVVDGSEGIVYEYVEEAKVEPTPEEIMAEIAKRKGIKLPPAVVKKMEELGI